MKDEHSADLYYVKKFRVINNKESFEAKTLLIKMNRTEMIV